MGALTAINPALLWGGLLIGAPIIIHLLSKRRFVVLDWAAMSFLLQSHKQNRRRVRIEHLLLLLLRCLAVLLACLLVTRPVFDPAGLGLHLGAREHVILLDDSPSMEARRRNRSAFAEARERIAVFLEKHGKRAAGESFTLLLTSRPGRPLCSGLPLDAANARDWAARVRRLEPSSLPARFDQALLAVERLLQRVGKQSACLLYLVSDLRRPDWLPGKDPRRGAPALLRRLASRYRVVLVDCGRKRDVNLGVVAIEPPPGNLVAGIPARFQVRIKNWGATDTREAELTFLGGGSLPLHRTIAGIPPGGERIVPFTFTFGAAGWIAVEARIGADALPVDDRRCLVARVLPAIKVLLVDGEPGERDQDSEGFFLRHALVPGGEAPSGYAVETIGPRQLAETALEQYRLVCLLNVSAPTRPAAARLAAWVRAGGGVVWFLGDRVEAAAYARLASDFPALMPVQPLRVEGGDAPGAGLGRIDATHPALRIFEGESFLRQVKFFHWWRVRPGAGGKGLRTLATFAPPQGEAAPAIIEGHAGKGRVMLFCTAADDEWGTWPSDPSYVVAMQETARCLARKATGGGALVAGAPLRCTIDPGRYGLQARLYPPGSSDGDRIRAAPVDAGGRMAFTSETVMRPGFYRLVLSPREGGEEVRRFAVNVDAREGDVSRVRDWRKLLAPARVRFAVAGLEFSDRGGAGRVRLWPWILGLLFVVLMCEQLLAWIFGRRR